MFSNIDCVVDRKHSSGKEHIFHSKMDNVCDKCRALVPRYPPLNEIENVYNRILLNQEDDHEECVKALLEAGADVNGERSHSGAALVQAASRGHAKRLQALITAGADVNNHYDIKFCPMEARGLGIKECRNALTEAITKDNIDCVKLLIKAGACVNKIGHKEMFALRLAVEKDNVTCADLLIKAGASVNGGRRPIYTPLYFTIKNKAHLCMDLLLTSGADVHNTGYACHGNTALMLVKEKECCRLLLKYHTQINRRDRYGQNALRIYMMNASPINEDICSLLFAAGETTPETFTRWHYYPFREIRVADYLPQINMKFDLKHLCREAIRKHLLKVDRHTNLFDRVPRLGLPKSLTEYLLYYMSLDSSSQQDKGTK